MGEENILDETDINIIKILKKNCRLSNLKIANLVGVSESTIRRRIKRMYDENLIKKFTVILTEKGDMLYQLKN